MSKFIDMTGWRMCEHGQPNSILTVIKRDTEFDKIRRKEPIRWICQCDCGTIKSINGAELRRTKKPTLSCGCLAHEQHKQFGNFTSLDLTNKKFGMLTPLYIVGTNKYHYNIWHCKCDCGNEKDVLSRELMSGDTISCGCQKNSHREQLIADLLCAHNIRYIKEFSFSDLRDSLPLRFDYAILDDDNNKIKFIIEHQGEQHYIKGAWHTETLVKHDKMKKEYCKEHNIPLYEIKYSDNLNQELEKILKKEGVYHRFG